MCTVDLNSSTNKISEVVQSICLEMDDLTGSEIPSVISVFMQYFDFDGKKMNSHAEWRIWASLTRREQMKQVLDLLTKLLTMCDSTTILVDSEMEEGGVTLSEFRVMTPGFSIACRRTHWSTFWTATGTGSTFAPFCLFSVYAFRRAPVR